MNKIGTLLAELHKAETDLARMKLVWHGGERHVPRTRGRWWPGKPREVSDELWAVIERAVAAEASFVTALGCDEGL